MVRPRPAPTSRSPGRGCVWIGDGQTTLTGSPKEAGTVTLSAQASSKDTCVKVEEGKTGTVPVKLAAQEHANGAVTGTVTVTVAPLNNQGEPQSVAVPFKADMRRPLNVSTAWTAFIIALLCGVLIPIGVLYLLKYLSAVIPSGSLVAGTTVVDVPRDGTSPRIELPSQQMRMYSLRGRTRTFEMDGYRLRAIMDCRLLRSPGSSSSSRTFHQSPGRLPDHAVGGRLCPWESGASGSRWPTSRRSRTTRGG